MWYRIEFFKRINEKYDLKLLFSHMDVIEDIYDSSVENNIKGLEDVDYEILTNKSGFAPALISYLFSDYDVLVGGSWDTVQELIESVLILTITKLRRKKFILWREDWDWPRNNNLKQKLLNTFIKIISKNCDSILVPGTLHKEYFMKFTKDYDKIIIMPNVSNVSSNIKRIKKEDNKEILYVGRLIKRKGVIYLLKAFELLLEKEKNAKLTIIGDGEEYSYLRSYVEENNLNNVVFTGKIDNEKLKKHYIKSNLVVVPSINYEMGDPWVFVLNEALYYNNPLIVTDAVGASKDMIKENGFIVEEKNINQLSERMYEIITDFNLQEKMSENSMNIIKNSYQYGNMVDSFDESVKFVLGKEK